MDKEIKSMESTNVDIYRETSLRYLGYANEVGESFRSIIGSKWVMFTYGIATAYVLADTSSKTKAMYDETRLDSNCFKKTVFTATDTLTWQMFASVIIPGYAINRTCALVSFVLKKRSSFPSNTRKWVVTGVGLLTIPFIIKPIDKLVDEVLDASLRKLRP